MLTILACSLEAAAVEPAVVPGGRFDADSLRIAADGTIHALIAPKQVRLSALTNQIAVTNEDGELIGRVGGHPVRHLALAPDGTLTVTPVAGPDRGEWAAELQVADAALDLDPQGQPVIVVRGRLCRPNTPCVDRMWSSRRGPEGFTTRELPTSAGSYRGLALRASADGWVAVSHLTAADFVGFVAWDGGDERRWFSARGEVSALVERDGALRLLYVDGDELHLGDGRTDEVLATGARHAADAVVLPDGTVHYTLYDADSRRLRAGTVGAGPAAEVDGPESGWFNALSLVDGQPVAAWYYYRNNYNKGVRLARFDGADWETWTQLRSDSRNVGWGVDLAVGPDGRIALLALDRSRHEIGIYPWPSLDAARAEAVPEAGDWTDRRRSAFFFAYGGGWYQLWGIAARPPSEEDFSFGDVSPATGTYGVRPGLGLEGGFAGKIGPLDLVLEYMRRNDQDEAFQTIERLQNLVGKLGIEDFPMPDSELQLHLRTSDLDGAYVGTDGAERAFTTGERLVELRYLGKAGYHLGLRYHGFAGPTDVFLSRDRVVLDRFVADGRFTTGSIVGGWAVMDYLKKYEVRFFGPYFDAQVGLGYASAALRPTGDAAVDEPFTASALTFTANGDLGIAAYRRIRSLSGAGGFVRVGVRGWFQLTGNSEPDPAESTTTGTGTETEEPPPFPNFLRLDQRAGPYANVGVVF